jgi:hypothetical protein
MIEKLNAPFLLRKMKYTAEREKKLLSSNGMMNIRKRIKKNEEKELTKRKEKKP